MDCIDPFGFPSSPSSTGASGSNCLGIESPTIFADIVARSSPDRTFVGL